MTSLVDYRFLALLVSQIVVSFMYFARVVDATSAATSWTVEEEAARLHTSWTTLLLLPVSVALERTCASLARLPTYVKGATKYTTTQVIFRHAEISTSRYVRLRLRIFARYLNLAQIGRKVVLADIILHANLR